MTAGELVGRWQLTTWTASDEAGAVKMPFGEDPQGCLIYTAGGWMRVQLAAANRAELATATAFGGAEGERADAYSSYVAYCGEYWLEGDVMVHRVRMSLYPNWVGREQRRFVELSGDRLVLQTPLIPVSGQSPINRLSWARAE
ncbi:MAG TPA: lipocalin-like domain-containing protein [Mycobacterium sp.]